MTVLAASPHRAIRVLSSPYLAPHRSHVFIELLVAALPENITTLPFRWKQALFGDYDILHVHWPEQLLRGSSRAQTIILRLSFLLLALRLTIKKIPVVWTVHNERPHEKGPFAERLLLALWDRLVARNVLLFEGARPLPHTTRDVVIPHGCFAPVYPLSHHDRREHIVPGRLSLFGHMRPYKGIEEFLGTMADLKDSALTLDVSGPERAEYVARLRELSSSMSNVTLRPGYFSDAEVESIILSAEVVVLPYRHIYSSGVALLALSLKRPIVVQRSPSMEELRSEVGGNWVTLVDFPTTGESMLAAYEHAILSATQPEPDLSGRDWGAIGHAYGEVYSSLALNSSRKETKR